MAGNCDYGPSGNARFLVASALVESTFHLLLAAGKLDILLLFLSLFLFLLASPWKNPWVKRLLPILVAAVFAGMGFIARGLFHRDPASLGTGFFFLLGAVLLLHGGRCACAFSPARRPKTIVLSAIMYGAATVLAAVLLSGTVSGMGDVFDEAMMNDWTLEEVENEFAFHGPGIRIVSAFYILGGILYCAGLLKAGPARVKIVSHRRMEKY